MHLTYIPSYVENFIYYADGWYWIKPTLINIVAVLGFLVAFDIVFEKTYFYFHKKSDLPRLFERMFSISHLTGFFGLLCFMFDLPELRAIIIVMYPLMPGFLGIVCFKIKSNKRKFWIKWALSTHIIHMAIIVFNCILVRWCPWHYLFYSTLAWFAFFRLVWWIKPQYKMIFMLGYREVNLILLVNFLIMESIVLILQFGLQVI